MFFTETNVSWIELFTKVGLWFYWFEVFPEKRMEIDNYSVSKIHSELNIHPNYKESFCENWTSSALPKQSKHFCNAFFVNIYLWRNFCTNLFLVMCPLRNNYCLPGNLLIAGNVILSSYNFMTSEDANK